MRWMGWMQELITYQIKSLSDDQIVQNGQTALAMGNTLEQHRSAIGRFPSSGRRRVSAKTRRGWVLCEISRLLALAKIRRETEQVILIRHHTSYGAASGSHRVSS